MQGFGMGALFRECGSLYRSRVGMEAMQGLFWGLRIYPSQASGVEDSWFEAWKCSP